MNVKECKARNSGDERADLQVPAHRAEEGP